MDLFTETTPDEAPKPPPRSPQKRRRRGGISLRLTTTGIVFLLLANLVVLGLIAWPLISARLALPVAVQETATSPQDTSTSTITPTSTRPASTPTPQPTETLTPIAPYPGGAMGEDIGLIVVSMHESDGTHLFSYGPPSLPLIRLTSGPWDDLNPAFNPDGTRVAFTSDRSGYWDIYILDIATGALNRLTDSLSYDGSPTWSPDGQWIAYETYLGDGLGGLEIYIVPVDGSSVPIRLTEDSAADYSPAWAPVTGRKIAFVSNRSGDPEIWVADLDKTDDERFINFSQNPSAQDRHPIWSPDEARLTWVSIQSGYHKLVDASISGGSTNTLGSGDWPVWSSDSSMLLTVINEPNQTYLAAYNQAAQGIILPPIEMPGRIEGITWADPAQIASLGMVYQVSAAITPQPLWHPILTPVDGAPQGRYKVVNLADVTAPHAMLHDMVDESFISLRDTLAISIGWDLLSALDNAYVPLTSSLDPGMEQSWLYTGRGFRFTASPINAGWMAVVREDYGSRTYWRIYLRVRYQDGSAGIPLHDQPWDFSSRFSGDTSAYEQGGKLATTIPGGYWVDFTQFAQNYGWQRVEALLTWRYSYPATRFNEYIHTGGLDWTTAMLQIYPPEVLITATPLIPPTRTPSPTPRWFQSPTPTVTASPRATLTPLPKTHTPTATPTRTQRPTATPTIETTPTP